MIQKNAIDLSGLRILITGAAGGIGAATARACAALGAEELILADLDPLTNLCTELRDGGGSVTAFQCDVSQRQDNAELIAAAHDIDAAVACAGICPLEEDWQDDPEWDQVFHRVMDVNLLGPMHLCRELLPSMEARGGGRIVLIGSIGGRMGILLSFVTFWSLPCDHTSDNRSVESPNSFRWMSYLSSSDRKRLHILRLGLSR